MEHVQYFVNASGIQLSASNSTSNYALAISPSQMPSIWGGLSLKDNNSNTVASISQSGAVSCSSISCSGKVSGCTSLCR